MQDKFLDSIVGSTTEKVMDQPKIDMQSADPFLTSIVGQADSSAPTIQPKVQPKPINVNAYDPTKILGDTITKAQAEPQGNDRLNELYNNLIKPTLKAIPRVVTHTAASLQQMPIAGISALAKLIATGGNLEVANKILEENQKVLDDYYLTNPEEKKAAENIGLATKPFQMAGEGLKNIVEQTPLKNTIAEPIAATLGEAAAMFGFGGIRGAVKGRIDKAFKSLEDTIPGVNGEPYSFGEFVKDTEPIVAKANELNKAKEVVDNIPDEALKAAYEKILDVQKNQLELEAKAIQDKIDHEKVAAEDLKAKGEEVQAIKEGKVEEEIEVPLFDSDKEMLKSLGYEEADIKELSPERIKKLLSEDESVESLNELKQPSAEPVKSGIDLLNKAIDELPPETPQPKKAKVSKKKAKAVEEAKVIDAWHVTKADFSEFKDGVAIPSSEGIYFWPTLEQAERNTGPGERVVKVQIDLGRTTQIKEEGKIGNFQRGSMSDKYDTATGTGMFGDEIVVFNPKKIKIIEPKQPITDLDLQTGTPLPEKLKAPNHPFRDKDPKHTETMHKLLQEKVSHVEASPEVFTRYLINEVNRYLNGEEVAIEKVRNGLSELATRADNLKTQFDRDVDFKQWRGNVREAARWARESDRLIDKRTGGTQLNMMIPVNELPEMVKGVLKDIKAIVGGAIQSGKLYRNKDVFDKTGYWMGKDGKWRYEVDDSKIITAEYSPYSPTHLSDFLSAPELFKNIPELKDVKIQYKGNINAAGDYNSVDRVITIRSIDDKKTLIHELQHAINDIVGSKFRGSNVGRERAKLDLEFYRKLDGLIKEPALREELDSYIKEVQDGWPHPFMGVAQILKKKADPMLAEKINDLIHESASKSAFENYMKDPGEMEARLASKRIEMSVEQKRAEPPWETLDNMIEYEGAMGTTPLSNRQWGFKLYSGIDPTEATKKIIAGAKALANYTAKAREMKEWKPTEALARAKEEFIRSGVDRSGNIRRELLDQLGNEGYEIIQKMYLSKGASSLAAQQLKQMRKEVYDGLSKYEKRILDNLILADRMLDIGKYKTTSQFKFPEGLSPTESAAYNELFQFIEKITPEKADLLKQRAQAYFEWMKKPLKDMLDAELITQAEYDALASHNYRRLKLVDVFDKRYQTKLGKTKRTVYDSGVEALSHGRETDVFEPSSEVMALEVFNRAYGRILNNAANKTLLNLAREKKDNPFVAVKEKPTDHIPSGWDRIFVYENGERKALYLSPTMSKEWITNSPEMSYKLSQIIRYASGSPILRTFATGIDWGFALANLPRDIMHIWYASRVFENGQWKSLYNSNLPVYGAQMGADIAGVFHDAVLRKGRYQDYIKEGGGMEFLVHQGRLMQRGRHIEGGLDKIQDFLGYFGETSEIMTRLAVRDRVIKRRAAEQGISYEEAYKDKKVTQEATFAARDYMDFGQGGGVAKAADNGLPYLNASIQGTRGLFRAFKDNPLESSYKLAQFAALTTGLYIASQAINPKTMEALKGSIDMQGNLCVPLGDGFGFDDEKGQRRYPYIKIPLDPGQKFFKVFFEASYDKATGQQVDAAGVANSLSQISPVQISSLPPTLSGILGYMYNKDFWLNDEIWKKTDKPLGWPQSKEEYIPGKTPQAFIDMGAVTGLSPERLKYTMSELVTGGSIWSWLAGQGYDAAFGDLPKEKKEMHLAEALSKVPIAKRFIGITNPYSQYAEPINEAKEQGMMKRWIENRGLDQRVESFLYEGGKRADVIEYIQKTAKDQNTLERLRDRFIFQEKIKDLPNRSFWLSLKGITDTEARAKVFVERFDKASSADQEQMNKEIGIVTNAGGIISDEFKQKVMQIRDTNNRNK